MRKYEKVLFDKCIKNVCEMESHIKAEGGKSGFMGLLCRSQKLKKKFVFTTTRGTLENALFSRLIS